MLLTFSKVAFYGHCWREYHARATVILGMFLYKTCPLRLDVWWLELYFLLSTCICSDNFSTPVTAIYESLNKHHLLLIHNCQVFLLQRFYSMEIHLFVLIVLG